MAIQISSEIMDGACLAFLEQDDLYGYSLTQKFQEQFDISESTIYPVLRRLKKNDYLETYDKSFDGRNRRYYRITKSGQIKLSEIRNNWKEFRTTVNLVLGGNDE